MREPPQYLSSNERNHTLYRGNSSLLLDTPIALKPSRSKSILGTALGGLAVQPSWPLQILDLIIRARNINNISSICVTKNAYELPYLTKFVGLQEERSGE